MGKSRDEKIARDWTKQWIEMLRTGDKEIRTEENTSGSHRGSTLVDYIEGQYQ